jgi:hypothetical protein
MTVSTWLDTPAGRFHAAGGDPSMPTAEDFHKAGQEEARLAARIAFDRAHRPNEEPTVPVTAMEQERAHALVRDQIYARANWITGDDQIRERLRRMAAGAEADRVAAGSRTTGPREVSPAQIIAAEKMNRALGGIA